MHLVQILLPLYDNAGSPFGEELYTKVRSELTERFGGLTAFTRAPAQGLWKSDGKTTHDDIVVFEVMAAEIDRGWWKDYRTALEAAFRQDTIVIRAQDVTIL
jgi:flavin-binding protein dodecin